ncbi:MAG: CotH kinase family protein [Flavobacteriales bacterium]|nr:MAG: CotH kinase family protein [Flavobacteriales bacterium]
MTKRSDNGISVWTALLVGVLGIIGVGFLWFGVHRASGMAGAAALNVLADGLLESPAPHRLRIVEVEVDPHDLDSLQSNLPYSGTDWKKARLIDNGISYPAEFRYRGYGAVHHIGEKKSFRLKLKRNSAFAPYERVNFLNPKSFNMINVHMSYWIAARMGVAVPWDDMVFMRLNGQDHGVMHACEQVDADYERNRRMAPGDVPMFKGDFAPTNERDTVKHGLLWKDADHWEFLGDADSTDARRKLEGLIHLINAKDMPWQRRRDSLEKVIEVDAFLRFAAAMKVLETRHIDNYHNQLLVLSPRTAKVYPVLWDPIFKFAPADEPLYPMYDALSYWLLHDPEWRWQRDRYIMEALAALHTDSAAYRYMDDVVARIEPSVHADRNKYGVLSMAGQDVDRYSVLHWAYSTEQLGRQMREHWAGLLNALQENTIVAKREGDSVTITGSGVPPVEVTLVGDSLQVDPGSAGKDYRLQVLEESATQVRVRLFPLTATNVKGSLYNDKQRYELQPWNATVRITSGRLRDASATTWFAHGTSTPR